MHARRAIAVCIGLSACAGPSGSKERSADSGTPDATPATTGGTSAPDTHAPHDSADTADTAAPVGPEGYCRSLDPTWADAYTAPLDVELAALIDTLGLLGDPTLYVDGDGQCRRRPLPTIDDPLPQLGRALFFSPDLSGDRDVACATCHHPALGGADALPLPLGPGFPATAVGEDRARGHVGAVEQIKGSRNTPSILNVALWDHRLMWDGRVEAIDPEAGFGGEGGVTTPDGPSDATDLVAAQALLPIQHPHEMGGSLSASTASGTELLDTIVGRLAASTTWRAAFDHACTEPAALPESWSTACTDDSVPLITAAHLGDALSAYQRSLVFVDTPWSAYVQGDVTAISDAAKEGALAFFRTPADGGLNCGACHTGDFFTDERVHAIGAPQIGPGDPLGTGTPLLDRGRAEHTADPADDFAFRTPTLLNVTHTPPYFHAGSVNNLFWTVLHYRIGEDSLHQAFGYPGEPQRRLPPWCLTPLFAGLEGCGSLYSLDATHDGDLGGLDGELDGIDSTSDTSTDLVVLFLEALTDPRVADPDTLAPWLEPGPDVPTPTPTSDTWSEVCQQMVEWPQAQDLRVKGARWLAKGALLNGVSASSNVSPSAVFGLQYWEVFGRRYGLVSGFSSQKTSVAAGVLALLDAAERDALLEAWSTETWSTDQSTWRREREAVLSQMDTWRDGGSTADPTRVLQLLEAVHSAETDSTLALAHAYGSAWQTLTAAERDTRATQLRAYLGGDFSLLPAEAIGTTTLRLTPDVTDALDAKSIDYSAAFASYVISYATFTAGPSCTAAFDRRQDFFSLASAYYGFAPWVQQAFFNLQDGTQDPLTPQQELAGVIEALETTVGLSAVDHLDHTVPATQAWTAARTELAHRTRALAEAVAMGTDPGPTTLAALAARDDLAAAEADLLTAELDYYLSLRDALSAAQLADIAAWIDCLEAPETQAMRGAGGFDALGGGSCVP